MGMDLRGCGRALCLPHWAWQELLGTAEQNGWKPVGTEPPNLPDGYESPGGWQGGYLTNDYQLVTTGDAQGIADGVASGLQANAPLRYCRDSTAEEFIQFCRSGEFCIG